MERDEAKQHSEENQSEGKYFYFDLADESHEKILEKELKEAKENPLGLMNEVTKVEY